MSIIKTVFALASLTAEVLFFVGLAFLVSDLWSLQYIITPAMEDDPLLLTPYIEETVASYGPVYGVGLLGAIANFVLISRIRFHARWFLNGSRFIAWLWMPLLPVGTLIGVVLLGSAREAAKQDAGAD